MRMLLPLLLSTLLLVQPPLLLLRCKPLLLVEHVLLQQFQLW